MDVILIEEVPSLGNPGSIVKVKDGYARNFLLPKKFAVKKSPTALKRLEAQRDEFERLAAEKAQQYKEILGKIEALENFEISAKTGEGDKIFGTITNQQLVEALAEKGIGLDKKQVTLKDHIKALGEYSAHIQLSKEFKTDFTFNVVQAVD